MDDNTKRRTLTIQGRLAGLNEYILAERGNKNAAAKLKREAEKIVNVAIRKDLRKCHFLRPVHMHYIWIEPNKRRDKSNISGYGRKVIEDALVKAGVLDGDGWKYIEGFDDEFAVDKGNPRIIVTIWEV